MHENEKNQIKKEMRETTKEFVGTVKMIGAMMECEVPGSGDLLIDVLRRTWKNCADRHRRRRL